MFRFSSGFAVLLALSLALFLPLESRAGTVTISPSTCSFTPTTVPLKSLSCTFAVTNNSGAAIRVTNFTLSGSQFQLINGIAPTTVTNGSNAYFSVVFAPTQAGRATGKLTVTLSPRQTLTGNLQGMGLTTTAATSLSSSAIDFGSVEQGQTAKQPVTITNTGKQSTNLTGVTADPPFATDAVATNLGPGQSYSFNVYFNPSAVGTFNNTIVAIYDTVVPQGVDITGTGAAASSFAINTFTNLPAAAVNAAYYASLSVTNGTAPYRWRLASGSTLPAGLTLSSGGVITGTVAASPATYPFTVQAQDSSSPANTASANLNLTVGMATGGACSNYSWNVAGTNNPILGLDLLGTGTYFGSEGGLYPNGSNVDDPTHVASGVSLAQQIQPLDANGNPDPTGKEVVLIIGESNVFNEALSVVQDAMASPSRNPAVVVVNGAEGDETGGQLQLVNSPYWTTIGTYRLPNSGVTAKQVVAVWAEITDGIHTGTFPSDMSQLYGEVRKIVQNLLVQYPNIKIAWLTSRTYAAYSNGVVTDNPEPYAYESGFPAKWTIQDQLNGDPQLNFDPSKGPVLAPWIAWGPYYWANGLLIPSLGGVQWSCEDFRSDGAHPTTFGANPGSEKVANQMMNFFKTDPTAAPWFFAP